MKKYKPPTKRDRALKHVVKVFGNCEYDYGGAHAYGVAVDILKDLSERLDADVVPDHHPLSATLASIKYWNKHCPEAARVV